MYAEIIHRLVDSTTLEEILPAGTPIGIVEDVVDEQGKTVISWYENGVEKMAKAPIANIVVLDSAFESNGWVK